MFTRWSLVLLLAVITALALPVHAQFASALTQSNWDIEQTKAFPAEDLKNCYTNFDPSLTNWTPVDGLAGALHVSNRMFMGNWMTAETDQKSRYFRVVFKEPLEIGTIILGPNGSAKWHTVGGDQPEISYLKADAAYPGDVTKDDQWVTVPALNKQIGFRVVTFPVGVTTRAVRIKMTDAPAVGKKTRSFIGSLLITKSRVYNQLVVATAAYASAGTNVDTVITPSDWKSDICGLNFASSWEATVDEDISPEAPQWLAVAWDEPKVFTGVALMNVYASSITVQALKAEEKEDPDLAPDESWQTVTSFGVPFWFAATSSSEAFIAFPRRIKTRALRFLVTDVWGYGNDYSNNIMNSYGGQRKRYVRLNNLMITSDLRTDPVPGLAATAAPVPSTPAK